VFLAMHGIVGLE